VAAAIIRFVCEDCNDLLKLSAIARPCSSAVRSFFAKKRVTLHSIVITEQHLRERVPAASALVTFRISTLAIGLNWTPARPASSSPPHKSAQL